MFWEGWYTCGHWRAFWRILWRYSWEQIWRIFRNFIMLWMSEESITWVFKGLPLPFILDTHARSFKSAMNGQPSCGTPQSQTIVVKVVTMLSTKLTLSWTLSILRMNVKQRRHQFVGFYQVNTLKAMYLYISL